MAKARFNILLLTLLVAGWGALLTGCCDCDEPTAPVEPPHPLVGSWTCHYATLQGSAFDQVIGMEVTYREDGTMDSPMLTGTEEVFTWYATDDRLTMDNGDMAFGMGYTIVSDTLTWPSAPTGPYAMMTFEYRFTRM